MDVSLKSINHASLAIKDAVAISPGNTDTDVVKHKTSILEKKRGQAGQPYNCQCI